MKDLPHPQGRFWQCSTRQRCVLRSQVDSRNVLETSDFHGATPLIMNARQRDDCSEVTTVLLEAGADIHVQDAKRKTALARGLEKNLKRIPDVLRQHGATD